jgi:hypothetical protein
VVIFCFFVTSIPYPGDTRTTGNPEVWATDQAKVHRQAEERQKDTPPVMSEEKNGRLPNEVEVKVCLIPERLK